LGCGPAQDELDETGAPGEAGGETVTSTDTNAGGGGGTAQGGSDSVGGAGGTNGNEGGAEPDYKTMPSNSWAEVPIAGQMPEPRSFGNAVRVDEQILLFGGQAESDRGDEFFNDAWQYNEESEDFEEIVTTGGGPAGRRGASVVSRVGRFDVFFGEGEQGAFDDIWSLNVVTKEWTQLPSNGDAPNEPSFGTMTVDQASQVATYFTGKLAGTTMTTIHEYEYAAGNWTWRPGEIQYTAAGASAVSQPGTKKSHLMGEDRYNAQNDDHYVYDGDADTFGPVQVNGPRPPSRSYFTMTPVPDGFIVAGGYSPSRDEWLKDVWLYSYADETFTQKADMPAVRRGHSAFLVMLTGGEVRIFIINGTTLDQHGKEKSADGVWAFKP